MNCLNPPPVARLVVREARLVQPGAMEEFRRTIRPGRPNQCWDRVDNRAKLFVWRFHLTVPPLCLDGIDVFISFPP